MPKGNLGNGELIERTKQLVKDALEKLPKPYGEDVTDYTFEAIEKKGLIEEYKNIMACYHGNFGYLNRSIGAYVVEFTSGKTVVKGVSCKRNNLAKRYSKLSFNKLKN